MTVIEDLLLRLRTMGADESASQVSKVRRSVQEADVSAKSASKSHAALGSSFGGLASMAKNAAGMIGGAGLAFGIADAAKKALAMQEVQAQLGASIKANVHAPAVGATQAMTEFSDSLSTRGGFNATEGVSSMTQFLRVTHNVAKSQDDLTLATNVARGAHVDLSRAVRAVTLLEQGRTTGLSKLGIAVKPVTTAVDQLHAVYKKVTPEQLAAAKATDLLRTKQAAMAQVSKQYSGAMATYSHSAAGGLSNLRNNVDVLAQRVGQSLLPVMQDAVKLLSKLMPLFTALFKLIVSNLPVIGALAAAWAAYKVEQMLSAAVTAVTSTALVANTAIAYSAGGATFALAQAWTELNAIMDANPITLIVIALVALGVAFYEAYKHVKFFHDFVQDVFRGLVIEFDWLKTAAINVFDWLKAHWPLIAGILLGPIALAVGEIVQHFSAVKRFAGALLSWFGGAWRTLAHLISWPFEQAWSGIKFVINKIIDGLNLIIKGLDKIHFSIPSWVPFVGGKGFGINIAPIGHMAAGGMIGQAGTYVVGERGPELVSLPLGAGVSSNADLKTVCALLQKLIAVELAQSNSIVLDGKVLAQSVARQGLLQVSRGG